MPDETTRNVTAAIKTRAKLWAHYTPEQIDQAAWHMWCYFAIPERTTRAIITAAIVAAKLRGEI